MDKSNDIDLEGWVDDHLVPLDAAFEWKPNVEDGLAILRQSRQASRARARKRMWGIGVAGVTLFCVLAFPMTRAFAGRCAGACYSGANQFGSLLWSVFSPSSGSETSLNNLTQEIAPDFASVDDSGTTMHLSDFRGKVVVLNFWATWCAPCAYETPWLVEFQRKYRDDGLVVVGVSMDEDGWSSVRPFMARMRVSYRVVIGDQRIADLYGGMDALPTTVIVGRSGRVASTHVGVISHNDFDREIRGLLNEN